MAPSWWRSGPYCRWTEQAAQRGKAHGGASPQVAVLSLLGGLDVAHPAHGVHDLRAVPVSRAETALPTKTGVTEKVHRHPSQQSKAQTTGVKLLGQSARRHESGAYHDAQLHGGAERTCPR